MRTKILLASAAALAAGVLASNAQVYSANVVGYANVVLKGNGQFTLVSDPFANGTGNYNTNIFSVALPGRSSVTTFGIPNPGVPNTFRLNAAGTAWSGVVQLSPGVGFFVQNGTVGGGAPDLTNTFVGSVVVNSGGSITNDIPPGYSLQGSLIPYAGNIAIASTSGGDTNINYGGSLHTAVNTSKSSIITFNAATQSPNSYLKNAAGLWNGTAVINVADGFYLFNATTDTNMIQNATY
jgi:hypothetical protein